jgi:predicted acetyltransferase
MFETRQLHEHERIDAIQLSDMIFREENDKSMGSAFPSIFSSSMIGHSFGAFVKGELVSFMGLVPTMIRIGDAKLSVYSLGSVCTAEEHRGKGIASSMLDHVFKYLENSETSLLLVSGDRSLYTRVNCCHFGTVRNYTVLKEEVEERKSNNIREITSTDSLQMHRVAQERKVAYVQSVMDIQTMLHAEAYASCSKQFHKTLIYEREGKPTSFLVLGVPKSINQQQKATAIEWAGSPIEIAQLMRHSLYEYNYKELSVHIPWHDQQLELELRSHSCTDEQNQGTVFIVNPERLINQLHPYINSTDSIKFKSVNEDYVQVNVFDKRETLHIKEFISFLFDKHTENIEVTTLQQYSKGLFPIPFPYTAGLNYV